jgi:hypothetical protein
LCHTHNQQQENSRHARSGPGGLLFAHAPEKIFANFDSKSDKAIKINLLNIKIRFK